ncbi:uncharacterized protein LOC112594464 [Melanaphis sacchari]|uniref:uncharacterized protein LOC112594464 n=1 Tax=Melanaphis sacchari TaxID=742174 RepID=UPI000DC15584|nr:uncharacterized protein LOC112594464 [Melanaphis sacchari]
MWPFNHIWEDPDPAPNAVLRVPISEVWVYVYKKERKYVNLKDRGTGILQTKNWMDNFMSKLRPKTPPGMCVVLEKRLIKKCLITIYKKKRIYMLRIMGKLRLKVVFSFFAINYPKT